jgi:hypothetical protein
MSEPFVAGFFALAVAGAIRSTWSPCGLSMLSTVTPLAERGRSHRFAATASWFILGGILGGVTLGAAAALGAAVVAALDPSTTVVVGLVAVAAAVALASDLRWFGLRLPAHTRQVDEVWLSKYRPWVYGAGFGWQIGVGLATYIMTAGVYLMIVAAALTANPATAFAIAVVFGTVRGLAVLLGARITNPSDLFAFHRRFDTAGPYARWTVIVVEALLALGAAAWVWGPVGAIGLGVALTVGCIARVRVRPGTAAAAVEPG